MTKENGSEIEQPTKYIVVYVAQLTKDIKEVLSKHQVPDEFYILQLAHVIEEIISECKSEYSAVLTYVPKTP